MKNRMLLSYYICISFLQTMKDIEIQRHAHLEGVEKIGN